MPYNITKDKLAHMVKRIKKVMKFNKKRFTKIKNLEKERDSMNNHPKKNIKTPPKIRKLNALTMEVQDTLPLTVLAPEILKNGELDKHVY